MADTIGTVRVELIADPSGIQRGIEQASGSLQRIATIGAAVGTVLAEALIRVGEKFTELAGDLLEGHGDIWERLSDNGQRAVSAISRGFEAMRESALDVASQLVDRLSPAFAQLVGQLQQFREGSGLMQAILDGVVLALKGIVAVAIAAVAGVRDLFVSLEALGSMAIRLAQTLGDVVNNITSLSGMGEAIRQGMADIARINEEPASGPSRSGRTRTTGSRTSGAIRRSAAPSCSTSPTRPSATCASSPRRPSGCSSRPARRQSASSSRWTSSASCSATV
jgi:methyl-accepting chemotaxis protein